MQVQFPAHVPLSDFLADYWQQRPLVMRQALPADCAPLDPEALAGLALEPEIESRLIRFDARSGWHLEHGPFDAKALRELPESDWTLLVQDVDKLVPAAGELARAFNFLPAWRRDDVMISYAADRGSVGPHLDQYDVFLVQALGTRRWRVGNRAANRTPVPDTDLQLLAEFETEHEWLLEPGDLLYLPPGVPHWGIAEGPCMTCSIGFRAPSWRDLIAAWAERRQLAVAADRHFRDPVLGVGEDPHRIQPAAVMALQEIFDSLLRTDDTELADLLGCLVTEPKPHLRPAPAEQPGCEKDLRRVDALCRHPAARLAYFVDGENRVTLFADGDAYVLAPAHIELARLLCGRDRLTCTDLSPWLSTAETATLLLTLLNEGILHSDDD